MGKEREELRIWRLASVNAVRHINHAADYFQEYLLLGGPEAIATLQSTVRKLQKQNELTKQDTKLDKFRKIQQDLEEADKVIAVLRNILTEEGHAISDSQIDDRIRRKLFKHNLLYGASREQLLVENRQLRAQLEQSVITCRTTRDPSVHSRHRPSSGSTLPVVEGGEGGWWDGKEGGMEAPNARNKLANNGMSSRRQSMPGLSENSSDGEERRLNNSSTMPTHAHSMRQRSAAPLLPSKSQIRQVEMKHAPHLDVINRLRAAGLNLSDAEKYFRLPSVSNAEIQVEDTTRQQLVSSESQVAALASHKQHLLTQVSDMEDRIQILSERLEASHLTISDLQYEKTQSMASMQQQLQTLIQTVQGCSNGYPPTFPILAATARTASVPGMMPIIPFSSSPIPPPPSSLPPPLPPPSSSRPPSPLALSLSPPPQSRHPVSSSPPKAWAEEALRHRSDDSNRRRDMNRRGMSSGGYEGHELLRPEKDEEVAKEDERDEDEEGGQDEEGKERSQKKHEAYLQRDEKPYRTELTSRKGIRRSEEGGGGLRREDGAFLSSKPRDESFLKDEAVRNRGTAKPVSMKPSQRRGNPEDKSSTLLAPPTSLPHLSISSPLPSPSTPSPSSSSAAAAAAAVTMMATGNTRGRIINSSSSKMVGDEVGGRAKSPRRVENDFYSQYPSNSMNGLTNTTITTTTTTSSNGGFGETNASADVNGSNHTAIGSFPNGLSKSNNNMTNNDSNIISNNNNVSNSKGASSSTVSGRDGQADSNFSIPMSHNHGKFINAISPIRSDVKSDSHATSKGYLSPDVSSSGSDPIGRLISNDSTIENLKRTLSRAVDELERQREYHGKGPMTSSPSDDPNTSLDFYQGGGGPSAQPLRCTRLCLPLPLPLLPPHHSRHHRSLPLRLPSRPHPHRAGICRRLTTVRHLRLFSTLRIARS